MPYKPNVPCKHPGCAALVPAGQKYCDEHRPLHARPAEDHDYGYKRLKSYSICRKVY